LVGVAIRGVLFDFSGTLFRLEHDAPWFDRLLAGAGIQGESRAELIQRLTAPVGRADWLPARVRADWARRDLDSALHRRVYVELVRHGGIEQPGLAEKCYEGMLEPSNWHPYPDAVPALRQLATAGIPVAVVSNIGWDIRTVLDHHGASALIAEFVLSYELGRIKPDPELFHIACERIGVAPEHALMIGDSPEADGGAEAAGSQLVIVDPLPPAKRPDALLAALAKHGLG
jgi:HAD superfamily hydrolase (TIGR01509 family)